MLLTVAQVARVFNVTQRQIRRLCKTGKLPYVKKIDGAWLIHPDSDKRLAVLNNDLGELTIERSLCQLKKVEKELKILRNEVDEFLEINVAIRTLQRISRGLKKAEKIAAETVEKYRKDVKERQKRKYWETEVKY